MRLSGVQRDALAERLPLPLYFLKRICRYLSNRVYTLMFSFFRLTKRPIPLELRDEYLSRNHREILVRYRPLQYLGPITLFRGPAGEWWPYNNPELGWKEIARGGLKIITIDASHLEFMEPEELAIQFAGESGQRKTRPKGRIRCKGMLRDSANDEG